MIGIDELTIISMMMSALMFALSFPMKLYKRSISAFITITMLFVVSNLMHYGMEKIAICIILITEIVLFYRAMIKPDNDKFIIKKYNGKDRRKC